MNQQYTDITEVIEKMEYGVDPYKYCVNYDTSFIYTGPNIYYEYDPYDWPEETVKGQKIPNPFKKHDEY